MTLYSLDQRKAILEDEKRRQSLPAFQGNPRLNAPELYQPSPELADAINVALRLGLPLLLTGDPGTGKTQLAHHLAWFFDLGEPIIFNAQTTSAAKDLFYQYDALGHFQYSQNNPEALTPEELERRFIRYKALGEAIRSSRRRVVLIDEVDKAPRDLPNDVLAAVEELRFYVGEIDKWYATDNANRPVIVLTSNSEKNLPDAFLRRVVYFHISFPKPEKMLEIVADKVQGIPPGSLEQLVHHFYEILDDRSIKLRKRPATAELIQWAALLHGLEFPTAKLKNTARLSEEERQQLITSYSVLAKTREDLKALADRL